MVIDFDPGRRTVASTGPSSGETSTDSVIGRCRLEKRSDFMGTQASRMPGTQIGVPDWADCSAYQTLRRMTDDVEHPSDFAIPTFNHDDLDQRSVLARLIDEAGRQSTRRTVLQIDAAGQSAQGPVGGNADNEGGVRLGDPVARVGNPVGEITVVGDEDQAFGVRIEPPHRVEALVTVDEVDHRASSMGIAGGADDTFGFVEEMSLDVGMDGYRDSIEGEGLRVDINAVTQPSGRPIDFDASSSDCLFGCST